MNEADHYDAFTLEVTRHFECYPTARLSEATIPAWWSELQDMPWEVIPRAFQLAREASQSFPATSPQVKAAAEVETARLREARRFENAQLALPSPNDDATQRFYATCDRGLQHCQREWGATEKDLVQEAIVSLALLFRCDMRKFRGESDEGEPRGISMPKVLGSSLKQRGIEPAAALEGIRLVPRWCARFPTEGMLAELCREKRLLGGWPTDWLKPMTPGKGPAPEGAA